MTKRAMRRSPRLRPLLPALRRARREAKQVWRRSYRAALAWAPAAARQAVSALGDELEHQASALRRRVLRPAERAVAQLGRRGQRVATAFARERRQWLASARAESRRLVRGTIAPLDLASAERVEQLAKRLAHLEQRLASRRQNA